MKKQNHKQTHRYREKISGYQWVEGREKGQDSGHEASYKAIIFIIPQEIQNEMMIYHYTVSRMAKIKMKKIGFIGELQSKSYLKVLVGM